MHVKTLVHHLTLHFFTNRSRPLEIFKIGFEYFVGFVNNVGDYLATFNIFILPSRKEGIGSILLDAMAMKLPVIACEVGGVSDIVHNNQNGYLIESERPDLLKEAILSLYNQPQLSAKFAQRGSEIAVNYTADVMCKKYLKIYQSILQDSNKT